MLLYLVWTIVIQNLLIIDKNIFLVLGERLTERLNDITATAEAEYPINIRRNLVLVCITMEATVFGMIMV